MQALFVNDIIIDMFGYIVPFVPELKVREFETFRAYYCGLCRILKERYGRTGILNYDAAFIYVLGDGLQEAASPCEPSRCAVHPVAKRPVIKSAAGEYAADINMLMAHAKASDDVRDAGALRDRAALWMLKKRGAQAAGRIPAMRARADEMNEALSQIEKNGDGQVDAAADTYAVLFGHVLAELDILQSHILYDLGYNLGRWVYLIDALDDLERDLEKDRFNVFACRMKESGKSVEQIRDDARLGMRFTLGQAVDALSRLELKRNRELVGNIVKLGLHAQTENVLSGRGSLNESLRSPRHF